MKPPTVLSSTSLRSRQGGGDASPLPSDPPVGGMTEQAGLELAREMRRRWRGGERPAVEEYLSRHPELCDRPEAAVELIYEEYCLRQSAGDEGAEQDLLQRFPQWAGPLRVMLDCHRRLLESERDRPQFPAVGERVADFRLLAELYRGPHGRVFLAAQTALAGRPVVLKVTPLGGGEHLSLARLQHTHIVPLYSVCDDAARNVRVLCMPYFGRATLASLLESLADVPAAARTGRHVLDAIDRMQGQALPGAAVAERASPAPAGAVRQMLGHASYVQAVCWVASCLADALRFAHERGVVHLDLKPSNVLLASDGQPMLLDFHLARGPGPSRDESPDHFGGTPRYMPPEQHAAMESLRNGRPVEVAVNGRADVFALGAILYELLGGALPLTAESPPLASVNPHVSVGLSDIVCRCVARRPDDRYADAGALADDLRSHLADEPLAGVPNRSNRERWRKWRRRRPGALRAAAVVVLVAGAAVMLAADTWSGMRTRELQAERALGDGGRALREQRFADAERTLADGLAVAESLPFERGLRRQLRDQLAAARRLHVTRQLHRLADDARVAYVADVAPAVGTNSLASQCRAFWARRNEMMAYLGAAQDPEVSTDLRDIAIFAAGLPVRLAGDAGSADRREALRILGEVEAAFGPSAVLNHERKVHRLALGLADAPPTAPGPVAPARHAAWEHCALGRALLASGDLPRADRELTAALELEPAGRWANFYFGSCAYRTGHYEDAVAAFSVCIGTAPDDAGCFYNRALAYASLGRNAEALHDYDRALEIDPLHARAAQNRGMLHFQQGRLPEAIADLNLALRSGAEAANVYYDLALVHIASDDSAAAEAHLRHALQCDPTHERARQLSEELPRQRH
jgi:serine/threonine protein kinase/tetratricopeptide (TPR) repeat protein